MAATLKILRTLHSWLGIIVLPWVVFFGFTGFYLNHAEFVRPVLPLTSYAEAQEQFPLLHVPLTADQAADIARAWWPDSAIQNVSHLTYHNHPAIEFQREAGSIIVAIDTGHYYLKSRLQNRFYAPDGALVGRKIYWGYVFGVFHRTGWVGWGFGTILDDLTAFALIIFGLSGMVLWYLPRHKRFKRKLSFSKLR